MQEEELAAKVIATNRANQIANQMHEDLVKRFKPLVGQKVLKIDGSLLAKYENLGPNQHHYPGVSLIFRTNGKHTLAWTAKVTENCGGYWVYQEAVAYVGVLNNGVLTEITTHQRLRTNYTLAEVLWPFS